MPVNLVKVVQIVIVNIVQTIQFNMILLTTLLTLYTIQLIATRFIHRRIIKIREKYQENDMPYFIPFFGLVLMCVWWFHSASLEAGVGNPSKLRIWFQNKDLENGK